MAVNCCLKSADSREGTGVEVGVCFKKGQGLKLVFVACRLGSKEMSKGRAEMSAVVMFGRYMSNFC